MKMKKIILYSNVIYDGIGDYFHLEDIYKSLKGNPKFKDVEFEVMLDLAGKEGAPHPQYNTIEKRVKSLNVPYHINLSLEEYEQKLKGADYIASISSCERGGLAHELHLKLYERLEHNFGGYKNIPQDKLDECNAQSKAYFNSIIQIAEHEVGGVHDTYGIMFDNDNRIYSMGLNRDCCGIKIDDIPELQAESAWKMLVSEDPYFCKFAIAIYPFRQF